MLVEYLGDAVYAEINADGNLVLMTEDHIRPENTIILEPAVWEALVRFVTCNTRTPLNPHGQWVPPC